MQFLVFILVYPFLWFISILPFRILYLISDGVYVLLYYVIGYRKKVVDHNLKLVFPNKSELERKLIRKRFYHHLCDMFLEMIKTLSISKKELDERFKILNIEELKRLESLNKSIILMYGHYASWEWSIAIQNYIKFSGYGVYKKLANKYFDKLVRDIRSKFNTSLISTKEIPYVIHNNERKGIKSLTAFISDQSPRLTKDVYWSNFMGIKVPTFIGAERLAKKLDFTIAYLKVNKVKRGFYEAEIIVLAENPKTFKDYQLTEAFNREVEKQIYNAPEYYFWTHKRWKHAKNS
ncbi:MAG: lysophospholipid acyltransferase family protein [Flavobacteriales bacterium]|nr:lysophospholipid acyltransferase family protein [Flavobacteriia bacterium]NCP53147.1 lysophospholipid acyltransferase family protein [Flavobacteriales bacterium]PIV94027.1 MAG: lipid A biosynthesis acyltransferase [Flavobacteriaceae bacterium CG17_big_fil_post_rev_8_21_14_2_50_33_15]PIY12802.1 MAG: lipid A biosynthesis acyltransferase [Flavobacteriaceae bacterium CG_4_10_14_3_um_filter_33_47]PJB19877.1 MAG: lipid A biosynthesis acyltransferase [Flavobacteriaceae bacterium CG_4_9_14_3_um_filt